MPRQMTDHTLDGVKGWPSPHAVDFQAPFKAADLSTLAGRGAQEIADFLLANHAKEHDDAGCVVIRS